MSVESSDIMFPILISIFGFIFMTSVIVFIIVLIIKSNKGISNPEYAKNALVQNGFILTDVTQKFIQTQSVLSAFLGVKNDIEIHLFILYPNASIDFIDELYSTGEEKTSNTMMSSTPGSMTVSYTHNGNYIKYKKYKDTLVFLKCNAANSKEANNYLKQMCSNR